MSAPTAVSLFSGIEGFGLGLERAGFQVVAQVEIDPACQRLLARHFPGVPRWGDITEVQPDELPAADLVCGGFPCQDISVAGRRAGLAGARSGLWWQFHRIVAAVRPTWVVVENVPGLLSSNDGRDMGTILRALGDLGYGWAYRVLDAQHFGLAQRRRRVFVVGRLGDRRPPAQVLLEPEGGEGHPAPRRAAGAGVAASLTAGVAAARGVNAPGRRAEDDVNLVAWTTGTFSSPTADEELATAITGSNGNPGVVAHALTSGGADASEGGTGRGTPLVAYALASPQNGPRNDDTETIIAVRTAQTGANGHGLAEDVAHTLDAAGPQAVSFNQRAEGRLRPAHGSLNAVRRLTPTECERLQGFPDGWTAGQPDSTRYRQLGNAVAVPVAAWIGYRILEAAP